MEEFSPLEIASCTRPNGLVDILKLQTIRDSKVRQSGIEDTQTLQPEVPSDH